MKKIKLFALAIMAMLSTNAFADDWANTTFVYTYATDADDAAATINGFIDGYPAGDKELVTIPNTVKSKTGKTLKVTTIAAGAFSNQTDIKKVIFAGANLITINAAFNGCTALADVDFSAATGLTTIAAGAFAKAPIVAFDFSKTKLGVVNNILGTDFDNADKTKRVTNATLTTLKLSAYWTEIKEKAFAGCTALATVDFGTVATGTGAPAAQAFEAGKDNMFAGCPITALDFTGTLVKTLPGGLLLDGAIYTKNESLTSVTLKADMTTLSAALSNCVNLATVTGYIDTKTKTSALKVISNSEFENDAALASFDFTYVTTLGTNSFAGTGLTKVEFVKNTIADIPAGCFMECASLATVTWDKADTKLATIGQKAFAGTAITSITFPKGAAFDLTAANVIDAQAFAACDGLKTVIWDNATAPTAKYINVDAFSFCSGVNFYTGAAEVTYWDGTTNKVNNVTFKNINEAPGTVADKLEMTAYKNGSGKYYFKMAADADIAIAKGTAKVYSAYAEAADDAVLNMISYKAEGGKYYIANGDVCIIISETPEVEIAEGSAGKSTSMAAAYDPIGKNALQMTPAATTRLALLLAAPDDSYLIYGWVNSTKGTGFQKITSGTNIPEGTLYAYAKEPADGARLIVRWYDEDGNLENEATAIRGIETEAAESGASYNVAGQKVNANYKGLVIKDGKKFMMK